jgi:hypothetical protein
VESITVVSLVQPAELVLVDIITYTNHDITLSYPALPNAFTTSCLSDFKPARVMPREGGAGDVFRGVNI